jgi:hypothetical protein
VALAIGAFGLRRRFAALPPMPRLPVRQKPTAPSAVAHASLEHSSTPAADVVVPEWFWDTSELGEFDEDEHDDPAEIPHSGLPLVSEASQSAALLDPAEREPSSVLLRW